MVKPFDLSAEDMPIASMVAVDKSDIGRINDGEYLVLKFEKEMYKRDSERYQKENDILRKIIHYDWDKKVEEKRREVEEYKRKHCLDSVCRQTPPKAMEVDVMVSLVGVNDELHLSEYRSLDTDDVPDKYVGEIFSDNSPGW